MNNDNVIIEEILEILENKLKNNDINIKNKIMNYLFVCECCHEITDPSGDENYTDICEDCCLNQCILSTFDFALEDDLDDEITDIILDNVCGNEIIFKRRFLDILKDLLFSFSEGSLENERMFIIIDQVIKLSNL